LHVRRGKIGRSMHGNKWSHVRVHHRPPQRIKMQRRQNQLAELLRVRVGDGLKCSPHDLSTSAGRFGASKARRSETYMHASTHGCAPKGNHTQVYTWIHAAHMQTSTHTRTHTHARTHTHTHDMTASRFKFHETLNDVSLAHYEHVAKWKVKCT
jgi:hypothetical protein